MKFKFTLGAPIIRFDNPHAGQGVSQLPHINIDPTGVPRARNPHIAVPQSLIQCADVIDKCLKKVSEALFIVAIVTDGIRILAAIYEDVTSDNNHILPHKTIETIASIAGGWSGAAAGATAGSLVGAKIGVCVGSLFGGVGAVIGAPIGAIVGSFAGAFAGGLLGSYLAENGAKAGLEYIEANHLTLKLWMEVFLAFANYIANPGLLVNEVAEGLLTPNDPDKTKKAVSILKGAGVGALVGVPLGPPGVIAGSIVGGAVGAVMTVKKWFF